jgi:hypothetical protein
MDQASCLSYGNTESKWTVECKDHFYFLPAWRRLRALLQKEFDNPDVIFFDEPIFQLVSWKDKSSELLEPIKKILESDTYSFCMKFRGVVVTFTGIHLIGYFEEEKDSDRFDTMTDTLKREFKKFGISSYNLSTLLTVPLCRFRTVTACERYKSTQLLEWSQCEFGELRMSRWILSNNTRVYAEIPLRRFICHRGNLERKKLSDENIPALLDARIGDGYDVELDVWYKNSQLFLGHDQAEHPITFEWLMQTSKKYIHTKDAKTLEYLLLRCGREGYNPNIFYHTGEHYSLTTRNHIIVLPGQEILAGSVNMMPEMSPILKDTRQAFAVCSDSLSNFSK